MSTELLDTVCKKLADNNINYNIINSVVETSPRKVEFKINSGREEHDCIIYEEDRILTKMIDSDFEKYKFILGYEAIWSSSLGKIECEIAQSGGLCRPLPRTILLRKLSRYIPSFKHTLDQNNASDNDEFNYVEIISLELQPIGNIKVSIGLCSDEFAILSACRQWEYDIERLQKFRVTLKLSDVEVKTHEEAYKLMEKISNSLFFQIDLVMDFSINLVTQRESRVQQRKLQKRRLNKTPDGEELEAPKYEYDPESMAFYWHAKSNPNMPLFQYLAYYQTIEFYFPVYSNYEAKQKLQNLIKDPQFNPNKDADITKLLSSIKLFSGGKAFGSEIEQLRATIKNCVTDEDLREFFESNNERKNFYSDKGKTLSQCKISIKNDNSDLIKEVAERIYDIRCLIVHTKSDYKIMNPFSPEVKKMIYDLELVEFIAKKVLIASSRPIRIN